MKIERNKNPDGRVSTFLYGIVEILDGVVRVLSLGFLHTDFCVRYSGYLAKKRFESWSKVK